MAGRYRGLWYFVCKYLFFILPDILYHNLLGFIMHKRFNAKYFWMNIYKPKTFSEKMQYLKKHPVSPDEKMLADKYEVREYIKKVIGEQYLIPLVGDGIYDNAYNINFDNLPDNFVLKLTKGSGYNIICANKSELDYTKVQKKLSKWLKVNPYYMSREKQYKGKSRIISELMLEYNITDYKFFCFNGKPEYVELYIDRQKEHKKIFYDMNWLRMPFTTANDNCDIDIEKPEKFEELYGVAKMLSKGFSFVRVDLYIHKQKIYFGELTFYPAGGYTPITPREWEYKLGELIKI